MYSIYDTFILLVDDDVDYLKKVKNILTTAGFQHIMIASSCEDAIQICLSSTRPYLVVMEYRLKEEMAKGVNEPILLRYIIEQCIGIKVIVLSGSNKLSDSFRSLEYGALSFIHKTDDDWEHVLLDSVRSWIEFYKKTEYRKISFRQKLNNLTIVA